VLRQEMKLNLILNVKRKKGRIYIFIMKFKRKKKFWQFLFY